ncbi:MAG TPA: hypothetical protein VFQ38_07180 [Longimicrobiales bacterium]|nr:hypothetical protein [Longimicrobiales bacterium]
MSATAPYVPPPPAPDPAGEPSRAGTVPPAPPPLGTLLASRPERERHGGTALGAAVALHALLILALLLFFRVGPRLLPELLSDESGTAPEAEIVTLVWPVAPEAGAAAGGPAAPVTAAPSGEGARPRGPEAPPAPLEFPTRVPTRLPPAPSGPAAGPVAAPGAARPGAPSGAAGVGAGASVGERLRPKEYDRRLFDPTMSPVDPTATDHDRAMARIQGKIDAINDSASALADAARRATDWTIKDKNGGRWGITPGQIHLGSLTLPLPITFQAPNLTRQESQKNLQEWSEIQQQADRASARRTFDERVKAIRERKEKEKAEKEKAKANTSD